MISTPTDRTGECGEVAVGNEEAGDGSAVSAPTRDEDYPVSRACPAR
jgi:hypothetical protein